MGISAAIIGGAVVSAAASGASGLMQAGAAKDAAGKTSAAAKQNQARDDAMMAQIGGMYQPYMAAGKNALGAYSSLAGQTQASLGAAYQNVASHIPVPMTQEELVKTPGYQWQLGQGLQAAQNSAAARGLGVSGASEKAAMNYAAGLANSNYQTQFGNQQQIFNDYNQQFTNAANAQNLYGGQLGNLVNTGMSATNQLSTANQNLLGASTGSNQNAANAQASGVMGQASAYGNMINGIGKSVANGLGEYAGYTNAQNALNGGNSYVSPYFDGTSAANNVSSGAPYGLNGLHTGGT